MNGLQACPTFSTHIWYSFYITEVFSEWALFHIVSVLHYLEVLSVLFNFITSACLMSCTAQRIQNLFSVCSFFFTVLPVNSEHFFLAVWLYITFLLTDIHFVTWFLLYCFTARNVPNIEGPPLHIKLFLPCKLHTKILYDQM